MPKKKENRQHKTFEALVLALGAIANVVAIAQTPVTSQPLVLVVGTAVVVFVARTL